MRIKKILKEFPRKYVLKRYFNVPLFNTHESYIQHMEIFNAEQIRAWDAYTIEKEPVSSIELMERASFQVTCWIQKHIALNQEFIVFCGTGNNGGDGFAIARQIAELGGSVHCILCKISEKLSHDCRVNLDHVKRLKVQHRSISSASEIEEIHIQESAVIIDALFGSGLNRPVDGLAKAVVEFINLCNGIKISIDIPSGMFSEPGPHNEAICVNADYTLSFQCPNLNLLLPGTGDSVGELHILDIGLHENFKDHNDSKFHYLQAPDVSELLRERKSFSHKGNYGHACLVGGAYGKTGAIVLGARACLASGAGLVSCHVPRACLTVVQTCIPEAMVDLNEGEFIHEGSFNYEYKFLGIGPGLGTAPESIQFFESFLKSCKEPLVLDADALNILSLNKHLRSRIPPDSILTPHPREFERLAGAWNTESEKLDKLSELAGQLSSYIILKGHHSIVCTPTGKFYFNSTGNAGMATGGSGDVLTGLLTGFLSQSYMPLDACLIAVYIHGLAGDLAAKSKTMHTMKAGDIIDFLPDAFKVLKSS